jgi:hypothetical protein
MRHATSMRGAEEIWKRTCAANNILPHKFHQIQTRRGMADAMKDLEDRQKSRATGVKRDTLEGALLDLAAVMKRRERLTLNVSPLLAVEELTASLACGLQRPSRASSLRARGALCPVILLFDVY